MVEFPTFMDSWPWPWPRIGSCITRHLHTKFHWNRRNFLWMDGRTDIWDPLMFLGRLRGVDLKSNSPWQPLKLVTMFTADTYSSNSSIISWSSIFSSFTSRTGCIYTVTKSNKVQLIKGKQQYPSSSLRQNYSLRHGIVEIRRLTGC